MLFILYYLFFVLYSLFFILYSLFFILCSLSFILYSLFFILILCSCLLYFVFFLLLISSFFFLISYYFLFLISYFLFLVSYSVLIPILSFPHSPSQVLGKNKQPCPLPPFGTHPLFVAHSFLFLSLIVPTFGGGWRKVIFIEVGGKKGQGYLTTHFCLKGGTTGRDTSRCLFVIFLFDWLGSFLFWIGTSFVVLSMVPLSCPSFFFFLFSLQ